MSPSVLMYHTPTCHFIHCDTNPRLLPHHTDTSTPSGPYRHKHPLIIKIKNRIKKKKTMTRAIITVVGKDNVGIIARICTHLADNSINILDISQTIVSGYFNMMMIVDLSSCATPFDEISSSLATIGSELGVIAKCQLEDIFDKMHRI